MNLTICRVWLRAVPQKVADPEVSGDRYVSPVFIRNHRSPFFMNEKFTLAAAAAALFVLELAQSVWE